MKPLKIVITEPIITFTVGDINVYVPFRLGSVGIPFLSTVLKRRYNGNLHIVQRSFPFRFNIFVLTQYAAD